MRAPPGSTVRSQAYDSSSFGFISFGWREDADTTPTRSVRGFLHNSSAVGGALQERVARFISLHDLLLVPQLLNATVCVRTSSGIEERRGCTHTIHTYIPGTTYMVLGIPTIDLASLRCRDRDTFQGFACQAACHKEYILSYQLLSSPPPLRCNQH